jgi:GxxExxY protein
MPHDPLSEKILGCVFRVSTVLGPGFVEKVYENALVHELRKVGLGVEQQRGIEVWYDGVIVGQFMVDILVEDRVLLELKAVNAIDDLHLAQALNYLRATGREVCLLVNFGTPKPEIRRLVPGRKWHREEEHEPVRNGEEQ